MTATVSRHARPGRLAQMFRRGALVAAAVRQPERPATKTTLLADKPVMPGAPVVAGAAREPAQDTGRGGWSGASETGVKPAPLDLQPAYVPDFAADRRDLPGFAATLRAMGWCGLAVPAARRSRLPDFRIGEIEAASLADGSVS